MEFFVPFGNFSECMTLFLLFSITVMTFISIRFCLRKTKNYPLCHILVLTQLVFAFFNVSNDIAVQGQDAIFALYLYCFVSIILYYFFDYVINYVQFEGKVFKIFVRIVLYFVCFYFASCIAETFARNSFLV